MNEACGCISSMNMCCCRPTLHHKQISYGSSFGSV